jgi:hypothetical protein
MCLYLTITGDVYYFTGDLPTRVRMFILFQRPAWQQPGNMCLHVTITPDVCYFIGDLATRVHLFILIGRPGNTFRLVDMIIEPPVKLI